MAVEKSRRIMVIRIYTSVVIKNNNKIIITNYGT